MSQYYCNRRLEPDTPLPILERDEHGALIGAYHGYCNPKYHRVTLYPNYRHPFVHWRGEPAKRVISDMLVKVTDVREEPKAVKSQTAKAIRSLRDIPGQERLKF